MRTAIALALLLFVAPTAQAQWFGAFTPAPGKPITVAWTSTIAGGQSGSGILKPSAPNEWRGVITGRGAAEVHFAPDRGRASFGDSSSFDWRFQFADGASWQEFSCGTLLTVTDSSATSVTFSCGWQDFTISQ